MLKINFCQPSNCVLTPLCLPTDVETSIEAAIVAAALVINVRPATVPLFGLRINKSINKTKLWLAPSQMINKLEPEVDIARMLRSYFMSDI